MALAILPALAYLAMIAVDQSLGGRPPAEVRDRRDSVAPLSVQRVHCHRAALGLGPGGHPRRPVDPARRLIWASPACAAWLASSIRRWRRRPSPGPGPSWARCPPTPSSAASRPIIGPPRMGSPRCWCWRWEEGRGMRDEGLGARGEGSGFGSSPVRRPTACGFATVPLNRLLPTLPPAPVTPATAW